jgi:isoleucyl-tRNA synthetase
MHKSWGNAIEFNEAADKMGVDVMRWLYCAHKPENNLLFGYGRADEVRRQFLIPLWNVYSFFVTYANIDQWKPGKLVDWETGQQADNPATSPPVSQSTSLLDRWIIARLHQIVGQVTDRLNNYDAYGATMVVEPFLDDLTNWYVRRSRRRFWKSEQDADKNAAYATLYKVLTTLCRLLAPMTPFVTEVMYQNLVRSADADAPESVHHTDWPQADMAAVDEALLSQMALARQVVTLGHSGRAGKNVKLRQPLARALVHLESGAGELSDELMAVVQDELNVKKVEFVDAAGELVTYQLLPNNKVLGPLFGSRFPAVRKALSELDPAVAVKRLKASLPLSIQVEEEEIELAPDQILVQEQPQEGLTVASEKGVTVALDIVLTPDLVAEGLARDVIRRVQNLRKEAGFNLDDRIVTLYQAEGKLAEAIEACRDLIAAETLSVDLRAGPPGEGATVSKERIGDHALTLGIRKA